MPTLVHSRRRFLGHVAAAGSAALLTPLVDWRVACAADSAKTPAPFELTTIAGTPRDRGRQYGKQFAAGIDEFLNREIYQTFTGKPHSRDGMLKYAAACMKEVKALSPGLLEEVEGIAEGSGKTAEELVLMSLHEELYHRSPLPMHGHCTAVAAGPPATADGHTYVGQTWDWMQSVAGMSSAVLVKREEGPSLLAYGFPGLWCGAGLNSAGIALCWTSAALGDGKHGAGPRVGIPSYLLLTHLLYQESLKDVITEAKRAKQAGWFTFVMADGEGNLLNLEGSPEKLAVETHRRNLVRVLYGSQQMTATPDEQPVKYHARCQLMYDHLTGGNGKVDRAWLQECFADEKQKICVGPATIDMMVYDCTAREAYLSRGPDYGTAWRKFGFG
jgi:hypothetical protein